MYIPIVVAMAAQQNVVGAIKGGPLAFLAGTLGVVLSFAMVPLIARIGRPKREEKP
jgi:malonate transporter MadL subunit